MLLSEANEVDLDDINIDDLFVNWGANKEEGTADAAAPGSDGATGAGAIPLSATAVSTPFGSSATGGTSGTVSLEEELFGGDAAMDSDGELLDVTVAAPSAKVRGAQWGEDNTVSPHTHTWLCVALCTAAAAAAAAVCACVCVLASEQ